MSRMRWTGRNDHVAPCTKPWSANCQDSRRRRPSAVCCFSAFLPPRFELLAPRTPTAPLMVSCRSADFPSPGTSLLRLLHALLAPLFFGFEQHSAQTSITDALDNLVRRGCDECNATGLEPDPWAAPRGVAWV